ncbi:nicotinate-nucleotide adenylyltransferase [uncultured Pseudoteredinibacter sp.]|uniref:nicotinate-nucleotide adenylyltransferase n=1 Tax=uncultured Pseudoteredinibacter sp. TaxID=1641701 RepID=UPI0026366072|nr:nicotinate-nucleotide adenylyltransferase [uncultured Pseudoteredinibacter sp.]
MAISATKLPAFGLFGGSFDPVHRGHICLAEKVQQSLGLQGMALLPAAQQPLKGLANVSARQRLAMLNLALTPFPNLSVDARELGRSGPSYTVDTLQQWRLEHDEKACLCFCMGLDSLMQLHRWHRWEQLFELANLIVLARPGWSWAEAASALPPKLQAELKARRCEDVAPILVTPKGKWILLEAPLMDISSTKIRQQLAAGVPASQLSELPQSVANYIEEHSLYCAN